MFLPGFPMPHSKSGRRASMRPAGWVDSDADHTMRLSGAHSLGIWAAGVGVGLRTLRKEPLLGLKRLALPVSYWRSVEFAYVWRQLRQPPGARVLDVGSPKDLAAMLARHRGYEVVATDILPEAVLSSRRYASAQRLEGQGPGRVHSEVQDG